MKPAAIALARRVPHPLLVAGALVGVLLAPACRVETIEVGSRLEEARERGEVPERSTEPGILTGATPEQVVGLAVEAARRNLSPESLDALLEDLGVPEPLREDTVAYLVTLDEAELRPEDLPVHAVAFLLERHDPDEALRTANAAALIAVGRAFALEDDATLQRLLVDAPESRMLHCHHASQPDLLMSSYASLVVEELRATGFACRPVRLGR